MSLRFPVTLLLSIVCLAAPAWADFQTGMDAAHRGDYATALREWRPLAERGDVRAQAMLGALYHDGQDVPRDYVQAREWYEKAAARGYEMAQSNLAALYANGKGVPKNYVRAYMWWSLAAGHSTGNVQKDPADNRDDVARRMTPAEIAEAQKLAREWKPKEK
jgi:TPR repeat protein